VSSLPPSRFQEALDSVPVDSDVEDSSDDNCDQDDAEAHYIDYRTDKRERGQLSKQPGAV